MDMARPDLGIAGGALLLRQILKDRRYPVATRGLVCDEDCVRYGFPNEPMYVYRRQGRIVVSHVRGEAEQRHQGPPETDEHKAYKERAINAAEDGGHRAKDERWSEDRKSAAMW
ncbi:hypothetical protein [Streptomyces sp. NPDC047718]|uniref:hypothetical protein n=1 Tax=Streptomyces sp. NPDC047718 TaxID=3155479 RepID=UPI0033EB3119